MERKDLHIAVCSRCGRRRGQTGALIPFKGGLICDQCVIEGNKKVLKEFEDLNVFETPADDVDRDMEDSAAGPFDLEEEEDERFAFSSPFQPLDMEKVDHLLRINDKIPRIEDLSSEKIDPEAVSLVPRAIAEQFCLIPIRREGKNLVVAFSDPNDEEAIQEVKYFISFTSLDVNVIVADPVDIEEAIEKFYKDE